MLCCVWSHLFVAVHAAALSVTDNTVVGLSILVASTCGHHKAADFCCWLGRHHLQSCFLLQLLCSFLPFCSRSWLDSNMSAGPTNG